MERTILHCDCNGFYASVEMILNPKLRNVPMAVCGDPNSRHGIILAKNELAKKQNVQTAETIWQARKKCPNLVLAPSHHDEYRKYSKLINKIYQEYTNLVEPFGIDESWLDVTDSKELFGDGKKIADELRNRIKNELGLTISVGVSFNKIFAKLGSDYKKPDATTVISKENFKEIVWPLPVSELLYVGKSLSKELRRIGITTIGQLANYDTNILIARFGKQGQIIHNYACGLEDSPVKSIYDKNEVKSIGNGITFTRNLITKEDIEVAITILSDSVAVRLRNKALKCSTVQVTIKNPEFKVITRQKMLTNPTSLASEIRNACLELINISWKDKNPIRMLTVTGSNLIPEDDVKEQISIFEKENLRHEKEEKLENVIDDIRNKFGKKSIKIANTLNTDIISMHDSSDDSKNSYSIDSKNNYQ